MKMLLIILWNPATFWMPQLCVNYHVVTTHMQLRGIWNNLSMWWKQSVLDLPLLMDIGDILSLWLRLWNTVFLLQLCQPLLLLVLATDTSPFVHNEWVSTRLHTSIPFWRSLNMKAHYSRSVASVIGVMMPSTWSKFLVLLRIYHYMQMALTQWPWWFHTSRRVYHTDYFFALLIQIEEIILMQQYWLISMYSFQA